MGAASGRLGRTLVGPFGRPLFLLLRILFLFVPVRICSIGMQPYTVWLPPIFLVGLERDWFVMVRYSNWHLMIDGFFSLLS